MIGLSHVKSVIAAIPGESSVSAEMSGDPRSRVAGNELLELTFGLRMLMFLVMHSRQLVGSRDLRGSPQTPTLYCRPISGDVTFL
jgi:hypothetical protein